MKSVFSIALLLTFLYASGQNKEAIKEVNGKTFNIILTLTNGKRSGWQWTTDKVHFESNRLTSAEMTKREKFPSGTCSLKLDSTASTKTVKFKTSVKNSSGSKIEWQGTVTGNQIEGTAIWTDKQSTESYSFSGSVKND